MCFFVRIWRAGRAGRQAAGKCFRLYTESTFHDELADTSTPEVRRRSLAAVVLSLKALGITDVLRFDFIERPPRAALLSALEELLALGALQRDGALSEEGRLMAALPLEPAQAKALVVAARQGGGGASAAGAHGLGGAIDGSGEGGTVRRCTREMIALLAVLSGDGTLFHAPSGEREAADESRRRFACAHGDTLTALAVLSTWDAVRGGDGEAMGGVGRMGARKWCERNYINWRTLETAAQVRDQLVQAASRAGLLPDDGNGGVHAKGGGDKRAGREKFSEPTPQLLDVETSDSLRRCLASAFFLKAAVRQPSGEYLALASKQQASPRDSKAREPETRKRERIRDTTLLLNLTPSPLNRSLNGTPASGP